MNLFNEDAFTFLNKLEPESIDLIVTDPPYESLEKYRIGTGKRLKNWFGIIQNSSFPRLFEAFYRVLKENTHLYMMCDQETAFVARQIGIDAGFKFWKPLVWDKQKIGMGYHYRAQYEFILFFEKGKRKLNDFSIPDVLSVKRIKSKSAYPTEKPVELGRTLIEQSTNPGETVLDPFMGSGAFGVAAVELGRGFIGNDISKEAFDLAQKRIDNHFRDLTKLVWE